jgi:hypothetical protein
MSNEKHTPREDAAPPDGVRRPGCGAWLAAAASCVVVWLVVDGIVGGMADPADSRPPFRMDGEDDRNEEDEAARPDGAEEADEEPVDRSLHDRLVELAGQYVAGKLDLDGLRSRLADARGEINIVLVNETAAPRVRWLERLREMLRLASLASLALLLGPWWVYRRRRAGPDAGAAAWASAPYFLVTAAAVLLVGNLLVELVVGLEKLQVSAAAWGSPAASAADATVHYLVYGADADLDALLRTLLAAPAEAAKDPVVATFGAAGFLFAAVQGALQSTALAWSRHLFSFLFRVLDLYGPVLALLTLVVAYRVLAPLLRNLVRYPLDVTAGRPAPSLARFVVEQLKVVWRELRAATWMVIFVLVFTILAVAAVRLLTGAAVIVLLKTLLAAGTVVAGGRELPDLALLFTMLSLVTFLVVVCLLCLAAAAVVFAKAYPMVRARLIERRRFRRFPVFWRMALRFGTKVVLPTVVAAGAVVAVWYALLLTIDDPSWRVWLAPPLLGPALLLLLWAQGVFRWFWRLARTDPLAEK